MYIYTHFAFFTYSLHNRTQVDTWLHSSRAPPPPISCPLAFIFPWIFPLVDFKGFVRNLPNVCTEPSLVNLLQLVPFTTCHPPFFLDFSSLYTIQIKYFKTF